MSKKENRWCYFIPLQESGGGFIPAYVEEGVEGYRMMSGNGPFAAPWIWGTDERSANEVCDAVNAKRGITKDDQQKIILSSMGHFMKGKSRK